MSEVAGKGTFVSLDGADLSPFTSSTTFNRTSEVAELPGCAGSGAIEYAGGRSGGTVALSGVYDSDDELGPRAIIEPLLDGYCGPYLFIRHPEGTGPLLPQDACDVFVTSYVESSPVADVVQWSAELQVTGPVDTTPQGS